MYFGHSHGEWFNVAEFRTLMYLRLLQRSNEVAAQQFFFGSESNLIDLPKEFHSKEMINITRRLYGFISYVSSEQLDAWLRCNQHGIPTIGRIIYN